MDATTTTGETDELGSGLRLVAHAIDAERLARTRAAGADEEGNRLVRFPAVGAGEPLRCCLRHARPGEPIALISHSPMATRSVWREVGPVYVHADPCDGWGAGAGLPPELALGPRVLRTYGPDGAMDYDHLTVVGDDRPLAPVLERLLAEPAVATVHVRTLAPQCFLYAVTAG